jgi:glycosyltransferase involved in cell wall biosynthesis
LRRPVKPAEGSILESPKGVMDEEYLGTHKEVNGSLPLVSVCIMAYQHGDFVAQAIQSALSQETSFPFEILIGEDESSDNTRDTCMRFAVEHQDKIRLFLRSRKNVIYIDGLPTGRDNLFRTMQSARGKYLALLDGDDYWTDKEKLERQVRFLEGNSDYSACGHLVKVLRDGVIQPRAIGEFTRSTFYYKDFTSGYPGIPTGSLVFKRFFNEPPDLLRKVYGGDRALLYLLSMEGKIEVLSFFGGVYRVHNRSRESSFRNGRDRLAARNISENLVYLDLVDWPYKWRLSRRICWNYLYLFVLHLRSLRLGKALLVLPGLLRSTVLTIRYLASLA